MPASQAGVRQRARSKTRTSREKRFLVHEAYRRRLHLQEFEDVPFEQLCSGTLQARSVLLSVVGADGDPGSSENVQSVGFEESNLTACAGVGVNPQTSDEMRSDPPKGAEKKDESDLTRSRSPL